MPLELTHITHPSAEAETALPLIFAHGLFGSARNFNTLGKKFATSRRVVLVDMRNHGDAPWDDHVDYSAMAEDLAWAIDKLCGGRAIVLGHSMGGKAAMALALGHSDLVAGVIVADIAPVSYGHSHLNVLQAMRALDLTGITRRSQAEPALAQALPDAGLRSFVLQNLVIEDSKARWRLNIAALESGMADLIGWPAHLNSDRYAGPSLFIYGGASDYMAPQHRPNVHALFPAAEFCEVPGAGHWLHAENPQAFQSAVSEWLERHGD